MSTFAKESEKNSLLQSVEKLWTSEKLKWISYFTVYNVMS